MATKTQTFKPTPKTTPNLSTQRQAYNDRGIIAWAEAQRIHASGLYHKRFQTAEQLYVVLQFGRALGIPDAVAASQLYSVPGTGTISAQGEFMLALLQGSPEILLIEYPPDKCSATQQTCRMVRRGKRIIGEDGVEREGPPMMDYTDTFTFEEAQAAGFDKTKEGTKPAWKDVRNMLNWKVTARVARRVGARELLGIVIAEEVGQNRADQVTAQDLLGWDAHAGTDTRMAGLDMEGEVETTETREKHAPEMAEEPTPNELLTAALKRAGQDGVDKALIEAYMTEHFGSAARPGTLPPQEKAQLAQWLQDQADALPPAEGAEEEPS